MQTLDTRLVTPEAVVLQFETGGLGSRMLAKLLDLMIQGAGLFAIAIAVGVAGNNGLGETPLVIFLLIAYFSIIFVYPAAFETLWRGRTPGKAALGLRVVTREGAPIRFRHAAIRSALWLVDGLLLFGSVGVIAILASRDNVRLGDMAAGTLVVRERTGARAPSAMVFPVPPGCEQYVATLDVSGVTSADYEAVRSMLLRAPSLPPNVRWHLSSQLGVHVATRMHHRPPDWTTPELFLACVAAAFQRRFAAPAPVSQVPAPPATWESRSWGVAPPSPPEVTPVAPGSRDFAPPA